MPRKLTFHFGRQSLAKGWRCRRYGMWLWVWQMRISSSWSLVLPAVHWLHGSLMSHQTSRARATTKAPWSIAEAGSQRWRSWLQHCGRTTLIMHTNLRTGSAMSRGCWTMLCRKNSKLLLLLMSSCTASLRVYWWHANSLGRFAGYSLMFMAHRLPDSQSSSRWLTYNSTCWFSARVLRCHTHETWDDSLSSNYAITCQYMMPPHHSTLWLSTRQERVHDSHCMDTAWVQNSCISSVLPRRRWKRHRLMHNRRHSWRHMSDFQKTTKFLIVKIHYQKLVNKFW